MAMHVIVMMLNMGAGAVDVVADPLVDTDTYARVGFSEGTYNRTGISETTYLRQSPQ